MSVVVPFRQACEVCRAAFVPWVSGQEICPTCLGRHLEACLDTWRQQSACGEPLAGIVTAAELLIAWHNELVEKEDQGAEHEKIARIRRWLDDLCAITLTAQKNGKNVVPGTG